MLLAALAEDRLDLFARVAACFNDVRRPGLVVHEMRSLVGPRILGLLSGLEVLNDQDEFRKDPVAGAVLGCLEAKREDCEALAGKSTLNRLELSAAGEDAKKARKIVANFATMDDLLVELLVEGYAQEPDEIVLDFDAGDFERRETQEERFYQGYDRGYCCLPVLMFVDLHPAQARLRTAAKDAAHEIREELVDVIARIRASWPTA